MWLNVILVELNCKPVQSVMYNSSVRDLWGGRKGPFDYLVTNVASHAGILS